jgi:iron(III) transport system permease protein
LDVDSPAGTYYTTCKDELCDIEILVIPLRIHRAFKLIDLQTLLFVFVLVSVLFLVVYPMVLMVINSFQTAPPGRPRVFGLAGWRTALSEPGMRGSIYNTLTLLLVRQVIAFPIAILVTWILARTDVPWRGFLEFLFWLSFFLPPLSVTLGWILLLAPDYGILNQAWKSFFRATSGPFDIFSFWGIVWTHLATYGISLKVLLLIPAFRNMNASFEEASRVSGASGLGTLWRIIVPMMTPAIVVVFLLSTIRGLQTFEIEMILGAPVGLFVYSTKIYTLLFQEPPGMAPATALSTITLLILLPFILLQRWMIGRRQYTTVESRYQASVTRLGAWRYVAFASVLLIGTVLTVVPVIFLLMGTLMKLFGFFHIRDPWTLANWLRVLGDQIFVRSLVNTLIMGAGAAIVAVALFSLIAYMTARSRFAGKWLLDLVSWLPITLPGILVGIGLLWVFLGTPIFRPFYGTLVLLIIATVISSMPLGTQVIKSNLVQIGSDMEEASLAAGANWWLTYRRIVLPLMTPVLVTVAIINFIAAARDISHIALLATHGSRTLALLQLDFMVAGQYEKAAVVATLVVVLSTGGILLAR